VHVAVTFLGILRDQLGKKALEFELPPAANFRDLLDSLAPMVEGRLAEWAWDPQKRDFTDRVMVSRNVAGGGRDAEMVLADGDEILVFPPIAGG